jgi:superfamily I DNA and/or RNA helicase
MDCPTRSFNLDLSLFERLALQQDFPVASLQEQHRMRPAISALIRGPVYPNLRASAPQPSARPPARARIARPPLPRCNSALPAPHAVRRPHSLPPPPQDHPSVLEYDDVKGMRHNLFWVTHDQPEAGEEEGSSKRNAFEAAFAAHLARYLVQQGGARHSVTVLTGYVGQLLLLRQELERHMCVCVDDRDAAELAELEPEGGAEAEAAPMRLGQAVRLATVDNFQASRARLSPASARCD